MKVRTPCLQTQQLNSLILKHMNQHVAPILDSSNGDTIAQLFSEAQASAESKAIFENNFIGPLLDAIEYSIQQGQASGEFKDTLDSKTATDIACGPLFFRLMAHGSDFNDTFQETYTQDVLNLLTV